MAAKKRVSFNDLVKDIVEKQGLATTKDIQTIIKRIERLEKKILSHKNTGGGGPKGGKRVLTTQPVFNAIKQKRNGADFKYIQKQTKFDDQKIRNAIFILNKAGRITRKSRGIYIAVKEK